MNMNVNKKELEQGVSPAMISSFNLMQGKRKIQYRKKENTIHWTAIDKSRVEFTTGL